MPRLPVPSVLNGVGRQPPTVRRVDHLDDARNVRFDIQSGATKREGFESVEYYGSSDLDVTYNSDIATEWVDRDSNIRYLIVWREDEGRANGSADATIPFKIINISDGSLATVTWAAGDATSADNKAISDYLNFQDADVTGTALSSSELVMITVGDTTFFLNKTVVVGYDTTDPNFVELNSGETLTNLKNSPQGSADDVPAAVEYYWADRDEIDNINILQRGLYHQYTTSTGAAYYGSSFATKQYTPRWVDDAGQLPSQYFAQESDGSGVDPHPSNTTYVEVKTSSAYGPLGWRIGTRANGSTKWTWDRFPPLDVDNCYLDQTTLPIKLVRQSDGSFELSMIDWTPRYNGDEDTNPAPSFVGNTITDITFFQNRLCFLSGENFLASESGNFFNFFLNDYTNVVDSDPIDVASSTRKVVEGQFFGIVDRNLYIFSKSDVQFEVQYSVETGLSPLTLSLVPVTSYQSSGTVRPESSGDALYFLSDQGVYTSVYEFYETTPQDTPTTAYNISLHTDDYIDETINWLSGDGENRFVVLGFDTGMYVYQYFWQDQNKAQSAWSRWDLASTDTLISGKVYDDNLYVLVRQDTGDAYVWHLLRTSLKTRRPETGMDYFPILDFYNRVTSGLTYNGATNTTTIVISDMYDTASANHSYAIVYGTQTDNDEQGVWKPLSSPTASLGSGTLTFTTPDNLTNKDFLYIGRLVTSELDLNDPFLRDRDGQVLAIGTTDMVSLTINYINTGYLNVEVTHQDGTVFSEGIEATYVGGPVSNPIIQDGQNKFIIYGNNRTTNVKITNDTPLPMTIASMEWELHYNEGER